MLNENVEDLIRPYLVSIEEEEIDPYEVREESERRVTHKEYFQPVNMNVSFSGEDYRNIVERSKMDGQQPSGFYEHDPMLVLRALIIACNIEKVAQSAGSTILIDNLMTVGDNDMTKIVEKIVSDENITEQVKDKQEEFIYALKATDVVSQVMPQKIRHIIK